MAKWRKKWESWKLATSPEKVEVVDKLLNRIFQGRIRYPKGTSHRWVIMLPELQDDPNFQGSLCIPVDGGQRIKPRYLQRAYRAVELLLDFGIDLVAEAERSGDEDDDDNDA